MVVEAAAMVVVIVVVQSSVMVFVLRQANSASTCNELSFCFVFLAHGFSTEQPALSRDRDASGAWRDGAKTDREGRGKRLHTRMSNWGVLV